MKVLNLKKKNYFLFIVKFKYIISYIMTFNIISTSIEII